MLMDVSKASLLVVDIQEHLLPAIEDPKSVIVNSEILIQAAGKLGVPVRVSEQYPKGLGPTAVSLISYLEAVNAITYEKIHFSCYREAAIRDAIEISGRKQLVLCGMESHICVLQTALDFKAHGYDVFVVVDAISSRSPHSLEVAKDRFRAADIQMVTTEMVLFEWMEKAGSEEFKAISALIK